MALPVFFVETISSTNLIDLNEETSKHIAQVLRMKPGSDLQLTDGAGTMLIGTLAENHKKKCVVAIKQQWQVNRHPRHVTIGISPLKNTHRFEWFLEKATELGVTEIVPLLCARTEKQHSRTDRMRNILIAAMLQSQQAWLPVMHPPTPLTTFINKANSNTRLIAHCLNDEVKQPISAFAGYKAVTILIGPEGDFSPAEIEMALQQHFIPVTLGHTRLRTETAGMAVAACLCI